MARRSSKSKHTANFDNVGEQFKPKEEYLVKVSEIEIKEGEKGVYWSMKLNGADDPFTDSVLYHNASFSPNALWRTRGMFEAFGIDVPTGDFNPADKKMADKFMGQTAMCVTYLDTYDGGSRVKPEDFFPADGTGSAEDEEFDLDDLSDDDVKELAKVLGIKGRVVSKLKAAIAEKDEDEVLEAADELGLIENSSTSGSNNKNDDNEGGDEELNLDDLEDDDIKALAKELGIKGRVVKKLRAALEDMDQGEVYEAAVELELVDGDEGRDDDKGGDAEFDVEDLSDDDVKKLAKELGIKGRVVKKLKAAIADEDEEEVLAAAEELGLAGGEGGGADVTEEELREMSEEELSEIVEQYEVDIDLKKHRTLRKKQAAVVDAMTDADLL